MPTNIKIKELMTKEVVTVLPKDNISCAAKLMKKHNIRGLVVVDKGKVVGIVTDKDIVSKVVAKNKPYTTPIDKIMSKELITADPEDNLVDISLKMSDHEVGRVPVVNKNNTLVGIVTESDMTHLYPLLIEYVKTHRKKEPVASKDFQEGTCDSCGNYSDSLKNINGELLCLDCQ